MLRASKHYPVGKDRKKFFIAEVAREIERERRARWAVVGQDLKRLNDKAMIYSVNGSVNGKLM